MNSVFQYRVVLVCLAALALGAGMSFGQESAQAATIPNLTNLIPLFTISWNMTPNVVHYDANLRNGKFDPKEPVKVYWVMHQTDGHHENLTFIERLKGYGFTIKPGKEPETWDMIIVSVKQKTMHISTIDGQLRVTGSIDTCQHAFLDHVRVQAHKWHMLVVPEYAELVGNDVQTGAECREKVKQE